ncbi:hypothetical protein BGZ61DRAFT_483050 [Ilyonectria robusta]|uniref:uncharacterized protein n=1 Tax=Ilyonectria robusta TaxID=1079257 RepID=UPI001E8CBE47|nr:uncharacterized protein BGZ61DRAFT_483050 [Ilyonectria robusta]KAH8670706.1 hypothetical protein BGZ61DRAFT_483050 [Ilyonectria robusta]
MQVLEQIKSLFGLRRPRRPLHPAAALNTLPTEIFQEISSYVSPVDRAALALVSHRHLYMLGRNVLRLEQKGRYQLLKRLEVDGCFVSQILCPLCRIFHTPRNTHVSDLREGGRACVKFGDRKIQQKTTSRHLPRHVHFDLVAAITRSHRHKSALHEPRLLNSSHYYFHEYGTARISCYVSAKVVNRRLLLKTEKYLFPRVETLDALDAIPELLGVLKRNPGLGACCAHHDWQWFRRFIFRPHPYFPEETNKQWCLWTHGERCWHPHRVREGPCLGGVKDDLLEIRGCQRCHTDIGISVRNIHGESAALILTTWKDLGLGMDTEDVSWKSHLEHTPGQQKKDRKTKIGDIHTAFETRPGRIQRVYDGPSGDEWSTAAFGKDSINRRRERAELLTSTRATRRVGRHQHTHGQTGPTPSTSSHMEAYFSTSTSSPSRRAPTVPEPPSRSISMSSPPSFATATVSSQNRIVSRRDGSSSTLIYRVPAFDPPARRNRNRRP